MNRSWSINESTKLPEDKTQDKLDLGLKTLLNSNIDHRLCSKIILSDGIGRIPILFGQQDKVSAKSLIVTYKGENLGNRLSWT